MCVNPAWCCNNWTLFDLEYFSKTFRGLLHYGSAEFLCLKNFKFTLIWKIWKSLLLDNVKINNILKPIVIVSFVETLAESNNWVLFDFLRFVPDNILRIIPRVSWIFFYTNWTNSIIAKFKRLFIDNVNINKDDRKLRIVLFSHWKFSTLLTYCYFIQHCPKFQQLSAVWFPRNSFQTIFCGFFHEFLWIFLLWNIVIYTNLTNWRNIKSFRKYMSGSSDYVGNL